MQISLGFPRVSTGIIAKKVVVSTLRHVRMTIMDNGVEKTIIYDFSNLKDGYRYRFEGHDYLHSASWGRNIFSVAFKNIYIGRRSSYDIRNADRVTFVYLAEGEREIEDYYRIIEKPIKPMPGDEFAVRIRPRLTFIAHHFIRCLNPSLPSLMSIETDIAQGVPPRSQNEGSQNESSANEIQQHNRFDNTCNYFRAAIGFVWREMERHVEHSNTPAPVTTLDELIAMIDGLEQSLMRQSAHKELVSHLLGEPREDSDVLHFYLDHDVDVWNERFRRREIWIGGDLVHTATDAAELFAVRIDHFVEAVNSSKRRLAYTDNTVYLDHYGLPESDATLQSANLIDQDNNSYPMTVDSDTLMCSVTVPASVSSVSYEVSASQSGAVVTLPDSYSLRSGLNDLYSTQVVSADQTLTLKYKMMVTRES